MKNKNIPPEILEVAKEYLQFEGGFVKYLGKYEGKEVYYAGIKNARTGFPCIYLFDGKNATKISEPEGFKVELSLLKN